MNVLRIIGVTAVCAFCAAHAWAAGGSQSVMDAIERASALVDTSPDDALSLADSIRRHMKPDEADRAALFIGHHPSSRGRRRESTCPGPETRDSVAVRPRGDAESRAQDRLGARLL